MQNIAPPKDPPSLLAAFTRINHYFLCFIENFPCDITNSRDFCIRCLLEMIRGTSKNIQSLLPPESLKDVHILLRTQIERFIRLKKLFDDPLFPHIYIEEPARLCNI